MGALGEDGGWVSITQKAKEVKDAKKAAEENKPPNPDSDPAPLATTDPGPQPDVDVVDEFYIEEVGRASLPSADDLDRYRTMVAEGLTKQLADSIIERSGVNLKDWGTRLTSCETEDRKAFDKLNTKDVAAATEPEGATFEPLPGVDPDSVCLSVFDASDLALRGRKALQVRRYLQPLVMMDAMLPSGDAAKPWMFGQKNEYQQEWRHEGFTLGDLVSSVSMLPGEEVTIEVSSYQRTKSEISREQDDTTRQQLEAEQKNTDERTCTNAAAQSSGWSVSASASVSYPVASASLSASAYGNSSDRSEEGRRNLNEVTSRSVSDVSSRRAVKITQTAESGSETTTSRRLRNPNPCQTVTFNFFQVIKLYDVQMRMVDCRPTLLLPSIFPLFMGPREVRNVTDTRVRPTSVQIPAHLVEGWNAPAVFLTKYFEVDRDLSQQISGWALRFRTNFTFGPEAAARQFAEALGVAATFLFRVDATAYIAPLAQIFGDYLAGVLDARRRSTAAYGSGKGMSEQLNTSGVYLDALRGRCTACTDHDEAGHYVNVMTDLEQLRRLRSANELDAQEVERRRLRIEEGELDPFSPVSP